MKQLRNQSVLCCMWCGAVWCRAVCRQREGRPHRVKRLILLSPAGFHPIIPRVFKPVVYLWRPLVWYMRFVWQQKVRQGGGVGWRSHHVHC